LAVDASAASTAIIAFFNALAAQKTVSEVNAVIDHYNMLPGTQVPMAPMSPEYGDGIWDKASFADIMPQ
jgi:hypothetical protein